MPTFKMEFPEKDIFIDVSDRRFNEFGITLAKMPDGRSCRVREDGKVQMILNESEFDLNSVPLASAPFNPDGGHSMRKLEELRQESLKRWENRK